MPALAILAAAALTASLPTVFGQPLGQEIAFPKCATFAVSEPVCVSATAGGGNKVLFGEAAPDIDSMGVMNLNVIDGKVEGVDIETIGHAHRAEIIRQLSAKFGSPSRVHTVTVAPYGITIAETEAVWQRPGYSVRYESIDGDMEHGSLRIRTTEGLKADAAQEKAQAAARVAL